MKNPIKYIFLIGAIFCGAVGMISMLISNEGIWAWIPWLAFIPAYSLLVTISEDYGMGTSYLLWIGSIILIVALFVLLFGADWGEILTNTQYLAGLLVLLGLVGLSLSQPQSE